MTGDFVHLHVHSHYSLLDGLGKINELVLKTKELGMKTLALTDHGAMYGIIEFVQTCKKHDIKPIVGMEAYLAPHGYANKRGRIDSNPRHITLLARNAIGYKNLIQLTTKAHLNGYYYRPRIDYDLLETHREGIIVLSGCLNGDIPRSILEHRPDDTGRLIEWHIERFGPSNFYLEVQDHPHLKDQTMLNAALIKYARQYNLGLVATADTHYIHPEDNHAQDTLICVQTGKTVKDKDRLSMLDDDFSLKSPSEVINAWSKHSDAIENTQRIADMCNVSFEFGKNKLPPFPLPNGTSPDEALRELCEHGLAQRYKTIQPRVRDRLNYELGVIQQTGFASYFLIVADFVNEAKRRGILVGPGRGSVAGSLVSYVTNITNLDPLAYDLLFERFLNPERVSMPDIDIDFADDRRKEVIDYVRAKYGAEHVAQVITFGTMAARAAVRDAGRAMDLPYSFCDSIAKAIPLFTSLETALQQENELKQMYNHDPQARKLIAMALKLEGVARHASTHAAAVVITDKPLTEYTPLQLSSTTDGAKDTVTQYSMKPVEDLGLLKIDLLGLKNLTVIQKACAIIRNRCNVDINLDQLPLNDSLTFILLKEGRTTGVFQLESAGIKRNLKELKPTDFEDIISILALYRPGPMDSIADFIAAKHGRKTTAYIHPSLEPILKKTYGVIVTQDQVLQIARDFAGFTYAEADILRKAVGKKIKELLDEQRQKFVDGAMKHSHVDIPIAQRVWDFIEPFARYGFNRAHAACYAMIAYQTAYLKANYPAEYIAALLTCDEGNTERQAVEVADAMSLGIQVQLPTINESEEDFTVVDVGGAPVIRFGLSAIKNVGTGAVRAMIRERNEHGHYRDIVDVFQRVRDRDLNKKSIESLARAGAFDCVSERAHVIANAETLLSFGKMVSRQRTSGQKGLFGSSFASQPVVTLVNVPAASKEDRLAWEKELLGMYISEHPLQNLARELKTGTTSLSDIKSISNRKTLRVAGIVSRMKRITTKNGHPMLFVTMEDLSATAEIIVFPNLYEKTKDMWQNGAQLIIDGTLSDKDGEAKILADSVLPLTHENLDRPIRKKSSEPLRQPEAVLIVTSPSMSGEHLKKLRSILQQIHQPTGVPVEILVPQNGTSHVISTEFRIVPKRETLASFNNVGGNASIRYRTASFLKSPENSGSLHQPQPGSQEAP